MRLFSPEPPPTSDMSGPSTGTLHPAKKPFMTGLVTLLPTDSVDSPLTNPIDYAGWNMDCISGYRWRQQWNALSPTKQGKYDWDRLDNFQDLCHRYQKNWSIGIAAGVTTPQWVYDAGCTKYNTHNGLGAQPVPWETLYQQLYFEMLAAFNNRYGADPLFRMIVPCGFMQKTVMLLGDATDEDATLGFPHVGYPDVDTAYIAAGNAILDYQLKLFRTTNFALAYERPFPTANGLAAGLSVRNTYEANWPGRAGVSVSALFAIIPPYGPFITSTFQNGQQAFLDSNGCCLKQNGTVNPDVYINPPGPPSPLPAYPQTLEDLCAAGLTKGAMYLEIYQAEIKDSRSLPVLQKYDRLYRANIPPAG